MRGTGTELAPVVETEASPYYNNIGTTHLLLGGGAVAPFTSLCGGFPGLRPRDRHGAQPGYTCTSKFAWCPDVLGARYRRFGMPEQQKSATSGKPEAASVERDKPVKIDLDPEVALRALLKVDPDAEPVGGRDAGACPKTWQGKPCKLGAGHFGPCQYDV